MIEIWKKVDGYEYEVSNLGSIRSLSRIVLCRYGKFRTHKGRLLKPSLTKSTGYLHVKLCKDGKEKAISLHRVIATTFLPGYDSMFDVNHKNGIKTDNRVENLEWMTRQQNIQHSYDNGLQVSLKGTDHGNAILNDLSIMVIRDACSTKRYSQRSIALYFKISQQTVSDIYHKKIWRHI